uniref:BED-type domain-containing protein n=1 Tax=Oncorhynchus tshawytscha TaxID=74940 RepID=A0A8C8C3I0_ONCTS
MEAKSKVWSYFGFYTNADGCILHWKRIFCRICMTQKTYSSNTSNLSYHLEKNHPFEFCEFVRSNTEQMREAVAMAYSKIKTEPMQQGAILKQSPNRTYISLSMHSLNQNGLGSGFSMSSRCLKTFEVPEDNTAENITGALYEAFVEWGITHKVNGATTNGSLDIVKACSLLDLSVQMPCLYRVRSWVSTLTMLQRLKELQAIISVVLMEDSDNHQLSFKDSEWNMVEGLIGVLQPFKRVADMITDFLHMLLNTTLKAKEGDTKEVGMAKEVISKVLSSTYPQTSEIATFLNVGTFLDPRYKSLPFLSPHDHSQVESKVIQEAKAILEKQRNENVVTDELALLSDEPPNKKQTLDKPFPSCSNAGNTLAVIFCQSGNDENQEELHAQVVEELSNFKSQKLLGLNEDPLHWWSDRMGLFPTLPKVLQKYWCVPATSVPSHRLFSSSGTFFCGKRNYLTLAHVDQQVFLYENSRRCHESDPIEDDSGEWGLGLEQDSGVTSGEFSISDHAAILFD